MMPGRRGVAVCQCVAVPAGAGHQDGGLGQPWTAAEPESRRGIAGDPRWRAVYAAARRRVQCNRCATRLSQAESPARATVTDPVRSPGGRADTDLKLKNDQPARIAAAQRPEFGRGGPCRRGAGRQDIRLPPSAAVPGRLSSP